MTVGLDVRALEKKAWKSFHQDGLKDVFLGLILIAVGLAGVLDNQLVLLGVEVVAIVALVAGKKWITAPRLGRVQFTSQRKAKKLKAITVVGLMMLLSAVLAMVVFRNESVSSWFASHRALSSALIGIWIFVLLAMMAYWLDFTRLYWIGFVTGLAFGLAQWMREPILFVVAGSIILIPGLVLFVRFLGRYPIADFAASNDHRG